MTAGPGDAGFGGLERRLLEGRAQPSDLLQREVLSLAAPADRERPTRSRRALVSALTVLMLSAAAAVGATSSAGSSSSSHAIGKNASDSQYDEKVIICHRPGGQVDGNTLRVSHEGAKGHLRDHEGDAAGPCGNG